MKHSVEPVGKDVAMMTDFERVVEFLEGPGVRNWQFTSEGIKLVNIRNIVNDNLDLSTTSTYLSVNEVNKKYSHFLLKEGDYVMASSGVTWGKIAEVKKEHLPLCLNTSIIKLVAKKNLLNKRYLWHFIKTPNFRRQINRLITGSAQPNFGPSHLKKIQIPLPPLAEQQRIADLLDAADALRQKDKALLEKYEALGQSLFLELFGDPVKNEKGWEEIELVKLIELSRGFDLPVQNRKQGNYPIVAANGTIATHNEFKIVGPGIITGRSGTIGHVHLIEENYWPLNTALYSKNYSGNPIFLFYLLKNFKLERFTRGAGVPTLNRNLFLHEKTINVDISLQNQFASQIALIEQQKAKVKENLEKSEELFRGLLGVSFK